MIKHLTVTALVLSLLLAAGQKGRAQTAFSIGNESFLLHGKPFVIRCGEMHFARIPRAYWRHRLKMAKAMGLNTICAYLFWDLHEPAPGLFNWKGGADAAAFCKIAQEEGLYVLLRPGPYSCAEWDFGGLPWWLLQNKSLALRSRDPRYLLECSRYLDEVGRQLAPLQIDRGGNILMVQVENEYGSFGSDTAYIGTIRDMLLHAGFTVPLFTCDGPTQLYNDTRSDIFCAVNFGSDPVNGLSALRAIRPSGPLMVSEYYPGWFDSWGGRHMTGSTSKVSGDIRYMLDHRASFSIYMVHGGTTFGLWSGANADPYMPETSSYDYDAPISENGVATSKYYALRGLLRGYLQTGETLPEPPPALPVQTIPRFSITARAPVIPQLHRSVFRDTLVNMEDIGQGYGDILYETSLPAGDSTTLDLGEVHDYALVYLGDSLVVTLDRRKDGHVVHLPVRTATSTLRIFVEAMGRVNYGPKLADWKGLRGTPRSTQGGAVKGWRMYPLPLGEEAPRLRYSAITGTTNGPALYKAFFTVRRKADTFLDMRSFVKGVVWINGHCLGRYWNIGPTQTMYLPGTWLRVGANEVVVMDLFAPMSLQLQGLEKPMLDTVK
jgi:beta-galactosidase